MGDRDRVFDLVVACTVLTARTNQKHHLSVLKGAATALLRVGWSPQRHRQGNWQWLVVSLANRPIVGFVNIGSKKGQVSVVGLDDEELSCCCDHWRVKLVCGGLTFLEYQSWMVAGQVWQQCPRAVLVVQMRLLGEKQSGDGVPVP